MTLLDLTRPIEDGMQTYPGDPAVSVTPASKMADDGARVSALSLGSHAGTHVDAPAHTQPDGATLGAFDLSAFRFDARLVDATGLGDRDAIPPALLPDRVGDADCLVFHTGWDDHWGTARYLDHPHLAPETARWCAEKGLAVGVDTLSPDPTPRAGSMENDRGQGDDDHGDDTGTRHSDDKSTDHSDETSTHNGITDGGDAGFPAHHALLGADCLILENLTSLSRLPTRFRLHAYPLAFDGDGAPVRAVAEF